MGTASLSGPASVTKISIITPVFNGARFIMEAASSVQQQSCQDWEWIIVNDGSTDGTAALLEGLDDPRIRIVQQPNRGVSAARNAALDQAQGEYVTFLDADDYLPLTALAIRAAVLDAEPDIDIVHGSVRITSGGKLVRLYQPDLVSGPLLDRLARLEEGVFFGVTYMMRRAGIGDHRFPEGLSHCEDLIFFLALAHDKELRYGAIRDSVYEYRVQASSAMSNLDGIERGYLELIRRSKAMPGIDPALRITQARRVRRILFRSWLRRLRPDRAILALLKSRKALQVGA